MGIVRRVSIIALLILGCLEFGASCAFAAGGEYTPVVSAGVNFHSGKTGKSISGANGYVLNFRAEKRKASFRTQAAFEFEYLTGLASIGADTPSASVTGTSFMLGMFIFPFDSGRFQPYVGASGILSWQLLKLPAPPTGIEGNSQTYAFGYELAAGVDMRFGSADGDAIRIQGGLSNLRGTLAGVSGFELTGFKLTIGLTY